MVVSQRFVELAQFQVDPESAGLLERVFCEKNACCIVSKVHPQNLAAPITLGMLDPENGPVIEEVAKRTGRKVRSVQLNSYEVRQAIARGFGVATEGEAARVGVPMLDCERRIRFDPGQSPAAMLDDLLSEAVRLRATDVHIETYAADVDLRVRIDGVLRQVSTPLSPENVKKVVSRVKVLCNLDIAERRAPQDGRFSAVYRDERGEKRTIHFRAAILPGPSGEDCVLRLLDPARVRLELDKIGMSTNELHVFRTLLRCPSGLILVSGPTGSGKTTTLYAALHEISSSAKKILTVEDPIEYELAKVNQKGVDHELGFADYARAFLRQNPDVMLIGEIRDEETAAVAVRAANTGHLVLATIHTQDSVAAVSRLRALGVGDELLSTVLIGVTAQRLLRRICAKCVAPYTPPAETMVRFYHDDPGHPFYKGRGCEECDATGYRGQVGLFEVFVADDAVSALIASGTTVDEIRKKARDRGFVPLVAEALDRVRSAVTTMEEVERTVRPLYFV